MKNLEKTGLILNEKLRKKIKNVTISLRMILTKKNLRNTPVANILQAAGIRRTTNTALLVVTININRRSMIHQINILRTTIHPAKVPSTIVVEVVGKKKENEANIHRAVQVQKENIQVLLRKIEIAASIIRVLIHRNLQVKREVGMTVVIEAGPRDPKNKFVYVYIFKLCITVIL